MQTAEQALFVEFQVVPLGHWHVFVAESNVAIDGQDSQLWLLEIHTSDAPQVTQVPVFACQFEPAGHAQLVPSQTEFPVHDTHVLPFQLVLTGHSQELETPFHTWPAAQVTQELPFQFDDAGQPQESVEESNVWPVGQVTHALPLKF